MTFPTSPILLPRQPVRRENLPEFIQGQKVKSVQEARVAVALEQLGHDFRYQVRFMGGRRLPGGQVLDFVVETKPFPTIIYVQSRYWHRGEQRTRDRLNVAHVRQRFGQVFVVELFGKDLTSIEQAVSVLRREVGVS